MSEELQPAEPENKLVRYEPQQARIIQSADRLFERAACAWVRGNNSGNSATLERCERKCGEYRKQAEKLLHPFGITVDYPGLYPSFTVNGLCYYSTESAVSAAFSPSPQPVCVGLARPA